MDPSDFWPPLDEKGEEYLEEVQEKLEYCTYCQPYDDGEIVWILGEETTVDELLDEAEVPRKYRTAVLCRLRCLNCGHEGFERGETVGRIDPVDAHTKALIEEGRTRFGPLLAEFAEFLAKVPLLALDRGIGLDIKRAIEERRFPVTSISGSWFRARKAEGAKVFGSADLFAPEIGRSHEGRYNHAGESVLYLARDDDVACREVIDDSSPEQLLWVQEYRLEEIPMILNLVGDWDDLTGVDDALAMTVLAEGILEQETADRQTTWKPEYLVTRFVADCAKVAGFKGIAYRSVRGYGVNLVLFDPPEEDWSFVGEPRVLTFPERGDDDDSAEDDLSVWLE